MVRIEYSSELSDLVEVQLRVCQKNGIAFRNAIWIAALTFVLSTGAVYAVTAIFLAEPAWILAVVAGLVAGAISSIRHKTWLRESLQKGVERNLGQDLPCLTTYTIFDQRITCQMLDVDISFSLCDLQSTAEDAEYLEIDFGNNRGLCVIPLRAFANEEAKCEFLEALRSAELPD